MYFNDPAFILIWSENPDELMKFYRDVLELKFNEKVEIPGDYGYEFQLSEHSQLWIGKHSEVNGKNKDPLRIMHNLFTDSVQKNFDKIKTADVKIISKPEKTPFYSAEQPWYVCTFMDPEDNCWQFMGNL